MDLDGDFTEPEFSRYLFIHQARRDKRHDLPFARRERLNRPRSSASGFSLSRRFRSRSIACATASSMS